MILSITIPLASLIFLAATMQTITGFGFALVVMPLMTLMVGFQTAAPLVALVGLILYGLNLFRYGKAIDLREVSRLALASAVGIPIGIWALSSVSESMLKLLLGIILMSYATYALAGPSMPRIRSRAWAYVAGFVAGCLGGAYNVPGPPAVVYGVARRLPRDKFRALLQAFFFINAILVVFSHALAGNLTSELLAYVLPAIPALFLGILAGSQVDRRLNSSHFRTIVTLMLFGIGASLALNARVF
jgi:uncharacterized membrane protein YfcA